MSNNSVPKPQEGKPIYTGPTPTMALSSPSEYFGTYTTMIVSTSEAISPSNLKWCISDGNDNTKASGNIVLGEAITSGGFSVLTYDNDGDNNLSAGDSFSVYDSTGKIQSGWKFTIIFKPSNEIIAQVPFS